MSYQSRLIWTNFSVIALLLHTCVQLRQPNKLVETSQQWSRTIFSWISWLTSRSRKFYSQNWRSQGGLYIYCTCWKMGEVTLNHKNLKWSRNFFMKIYFDTNLERFTKFLNHETLELYSTFTSKMPLKSADFLHKDMTYCHSGFSRGL